MPMLQAYIYGRRKRGDRQEVELRLFDSEGSPLDLSGGNLASLLVIALTHDGENWVDSSGTTYSARPDGYALVIWVGPNPGSLAANNDLWVLTS